MDGLSNEQQAILMFVSLLMIGIGGVAAPMGIPPVVSTILILAGVFGATLKEVLGITANSVSGPVAPSATTPTPFSVAAAKAAGFAVYLNPNYSGGYVLQSSSGYYDIDGDFLGTTAPQGTGAAQ